MFLTELIKLSARHGGFGARVVLLAVWPCVSGPCLALPRHGRRALAAAGSRPCSPHTCGQRRGSFPGRTPGAPLALLGPVPALGPGNRVLGGVGFPESHGLRWGGRPSLPGQTPGCLDNPHLCRVRRGLVLREFFLYRVCWIFLFPSCKSPLGWSPETLTLRLIFLGFCVLSPLPCCGKSARTGGPLA